MHACVMGSVLIGGYIAVVSASAFHAVDPGSIPGSGSAGEVFVLLYSIE